VIKIALKMSIDKCESNFKLCDAHFHASELRLRLEESLHRTCSHGWMSL